MSEVSEEQQPLFFSNFSSLQFSVYNDPFTFIDHLSIRVGPFELNLFKDDASLRHGVKRIVMFAGFMWFIMGWDSAATQLELLIRAYIFDFYWGNITFQELIDIYWFDYGKGVHWSAFVFYGLLYYGLSRYYSKHLGLSNSRNIFLSAGFTLFSIGIFETFWHHSFAYFQHQPWTLKWAWPQLRILIQSRSWLLVGILTTLMVRIPHGSYVWIPFKKRYMELQTWLPTLSLRVNRWTILLFMLTCGSIYVWWTYGLHFPIDYFTVDVVGTPPWMNTPYFPQTLYTVETNVLDTINAGTHFYVRNDLLHLVNNVVKVFVTATTYQLCKLQRVEKR